MTAALSAAALAPAADRTWAWPLDPAGYDRRGELDAVEIQALGELGWLVRRRRGHDPDLPQWRVIGQAAAAAGRRPGGPGLVPGHARITGGQ